MRKIHRDIVGGFIFSQDGKILLGKNRIGGVYEGMFVVPGGGVDEGETKLQALRREMLEETGLDINKAEVSELNRAQGQHEKSLRDTGERVLVIMDFFDYKITFPDVSSNIKLLTEDDWSEPQWFTPEELAALQLSTPTKNTLIKAGILAG